MDESKEPVQVPSTNQEEHYGLSMALLLTHSTRVALWIDQRVVPLIFGLCLVGNTLAGLIMIASPPTEFSSAVYIEAQTLLPMRAWGAVLLCLTLPTALAWMVAGRCKFVALMSIYVLGAGYWGFWAYLAFMSARGLNGSSPLVSVFSLVIGITFVIVGLAWPVRPRPSLFPHRPPGG